MLVKLSRQPAFCRQQDPNGCWFACWLMARSVVCDGLPAAYGKEKLAFQQSALYQTAKQAGIDLFRQGAEGYVVAALMQQLDPRYQLLYTKTAVLDTGTLARIADSIAQNRPVVLGYQTAAYFHYVLVVNCDTANYSLEILDPNGNGTASAFPAGTTRGRLELHCCAGGMDKEECRAY